MMESSVDGLRGWQTQYRDGATPVVSQSRTVYGTGGNRYVTNTAPDGSYVVSAYLYGRLVAMTQKNSAGSQMGQTTYGYDAHGRQNSQTDARNGTMIYTFNTADSPVTITTPAPGTGQSAQTTTTYYNQMLQVTNVVKADGGSVITEYFLTGELKKTYGSETYPVEYTYDEGGRMKTMKTWQNFAGNSGAATTTWNYDAYRGFLAGKVYADNQGPSYTYTAAGRMLTRAWARGVMTTYGYDTAGDLQTVAYSDSTPGVTYDEDRVGRQTSIVNDGVTTTLAYNTANELLSESYAGGVLNGLAVTNGFDAYLRRSAVALNTFSYDTAGRMQGVTNGNYNATYSYLANSSLVSQIVFKTNTTTRMTTIKTYDYLNRLQQISSVGTGSTPSSFAYTYNSANQRTRVNQNDGSYWRYEYDSLGQVKRGAKFFSDGYPVPGQQFEYGFDDIGNRKSMKAGGDENGANLRSASYAVNTLNQSTQRDVPGYKDIIGIALATNAVTVNSQSTYRKGEYFRKELSVANSSAPVWQSVSVAASGETTVNGNVFVPQTPEVFNYDLDGNLTSDGRWTYTWDAKNRLTKVESLSSSPTASKRRVTWEYDGKGRRIRQTTYNGSSGSYVVTEDLKFVSDGWRCLAELNAVNNALVRFYVWGLDLSGTLDRAGGVGGLLMLNSVANGAHFYAYDGNGNVAALVKASDGTGSANYGYDPFGQKLRETGAMAIENRFQFSTKRCDPTADFMLYEFRVLRIDVSKWLSRDSADEQGGLNLYGFVNNEPVSLTDFLGKWPTHVRHTHQNAIERIFSGKMKRECIEILKIQQEIMDMFQLNISAYIHAMRKPHESKAQAWTKVNAWIRRQLELARSSKDDCDCRKAMTHLGNAIHTLQDNTSPAHNGFQLWDESWDVAHDRVLIHVTREFYDPGDGSLLDFATEEALDYFTGAKPFPQDFIPFPNP